MCILIEYPVGVVLEAVVLSIEPNRLRVAVAGFSDALAFSRPDLGWVTDTGQKIDLGFLQFGASDLEAVLPSVGRTLAAGAGSHAAGI